MTKGYRVEGEGTFSTACVSMYICVLQYNNVCTCIYVCSFCNKKKNVGLGYDGIMGGQEHTRAIMIATEFLECKSA